MLTLARHRRRIGAAWKVSRKLDALLPGGVASMTGAGLLRVLRAHGCVVIRRRGSHVRVRCGTCVTTVPVHAGEDLDPGLLARIRRDLAPCLGKGWLDR